MRAALRAEGVVRRFGAVAALRGVTFELFEGSALAVLGPNGAGKTTLLRLCAGLLRPNAGRLWVFGKEVADFDVSLRRRVGFLSHRSFLYPDLTVTQNLFFYGRLFGVARLGERIAELLGNFGLEPWAARAVRELSRGLEQRCALARALLHDPELLLLDEPFAGLDPTATEGLLGLLRNEKNRGRTVVLSTHDLGKAKELADSFLLLVHGTVRARGPLDPEVPIEELYARGTRVA